MEGDSVLLVRLLPGLSLRHRGAATVALAELLAAVAPSRVVIAPVEPVTPSAVSVILRAHQWCHGQGLPLSVIGNRALRRLLEESIPGHARTAAPR